MKVFEIQELQSSPYHYIVLSTSYINPLEQIDEIESSLMSCFQGLVIFDMLLSNGIASNRFIEAEFDGQRFKSSSFKIVNGVEDSVKKQISSFYKTNDKYLDNSVLSSVDKFLVKSGRYA